MLNINYMLISRRGGVHLLKPLQIYNFLVETNQGEMDISKGNVYFSDSIE